MGAQRQYEDLGQLGQDEPTEQWLQRHPNIQKTSARYRTVEPSSGANVIPRRARPGLAGPSETMGAQRRRTEGTLLTNRPGQWLQCQDNGPNAKPMAPISRQWLQYQADGSNAKPMAPTCAESSEAHRAAGLSIAIPKAGLHGYLAHKKTPTP